VFCTPHRTTRVTRTLPYHLNNAAIYPLFGCVLLTEQADTPWRHFTTTVEDMDARLLVRTARHRHRRQTHNALRRTRRFYTHTLLSTIHASATHLPSSSPFAAAEYWRAGGILGCWILKQRYRAFLGRNTQHCLLKPRTVLHFRGLWVLIGFYFSACTSVVSLYYLLTRRHPLPQPTRLRSEQSCLCATPRQTRRQGYSGVRTIPSAPGNSERASVLNLPATPYLLHFTCPLDLLTPRRLRRAAHTVTPALRGAYLGSYSCATQHTTPLWDLVFLPAHLPGHLLAPQAVQRICGCWHLPPRMPGTLLTRRLCAPGHSSYRRLHSSRCSLRIYLPFSSTAHKRDSTGHFTHCLLDVFTSRMSPDACRRLEFSPFMAYCIAACAPRFVVAGCLAPAYRHSACPALFSLG